MTTTAAVSLGFCPQCQRQVRVSEPYAFRGMSREHTTLACGHVVLRERAFDTTHQITVERSGSHGYPYRAHCTCGWQSKSYAAAHAAALMGDDHTTQERR